MVSFAFEAGRGGGGEAVSLSGQRRSEGHMCNIPLRGPQHVRAIKTPKLAVCCVSTSIKQVPFSPSSTNINRNTTAAC